MDADKVDSAKVRSTEFKHDWYQTDSNVVITVFIKNTTQENVSVDFQERNVYLRVKHHGETEFTANLDLWHFIRPSECTYKIYSTKIEIKLKKNEDLRWDALEEQGPHASIRHFDSSERPSSSLTSQYPSSAPKKHDWDKLEAEVKRDEESEKAEGDAALNNLFQKIYADGSEEVKRAMNKSFMESGGTVLSTNWKEVGDKEVEVKAPEGMEWKKWEK